MIPRDNALLLSSILLLLLLGLAAGCAKGEGAGAAGPQTEAAQAPAPEAVAPAGGEAGGAPALEERYCLWLLYSRDPAILQEARRRLEEGQPFPMVAEALARAHRDQAAANVDCLRESKMQPELVSAVKELEMGQVGGPVALGDGQALIMRTEDIHRRRGREAFEAGRLDEAEKEILADLALNPTHAPGWHLIGMIRASRGDHQGALEALDKALVLRPDDPALLNDKASTLVAAGQPQAALPLLERAHELLPREPRIMANLAWGLSQAQTDLERALDLALRATEMEPKNPQFWITLGSVQQLLERHAEAVASLHQAARLDPRSAQIAAPRLVKSLMALDPATVARLQGGAGKPAPRAPKPAPEEPARAARIDGLGQAEARTTSEAVPLRPIAGGKEKAGKARPKVSPRPAAARRVKVDPAPLAPIAETPEARTRPPAAAKPVRKVRAALPPLPAEVESKGRPVPSPGEVEHFLQVAVHQVSQAAEAEAASWRKLGIPVRIDPLRGATGQVWYRILLGPYPDQEAALALADQLSRKGDILTYMVVTRPAAAP